MSKIMEPLTDLELIEEVRSGKTPRRLRMLMRRHQERIYWAATENSRGYADATTSHRKTFVKAF